MGQEGQLVELLFHRCKRFRGTSVDPLNVLPFLLEGLLQGIKSQVGVEMAGLGKALEGISPIVCLGLKPVQKGFPIAKEASQVPPARGEMEGMAVLEKLLRILCCFFLTSSGWRSIIAHVCSQNSVDRSTLKMWRIGPFFAPVSLIHVIRSWCSNL